ncbi:NYN domain-containing protein [Candidatus Protochlamydia phocaeensis]|uniref:NYN domain-containing protein n=1 Tax=Candidatus Protochlamydia phocaeensis TaxID=1414722 RepID=UPI0008382A12|nr:NYN domain-containing protein [Candidatus Protochlamydia phocaeensis]
MHYFIDGYNLLFRLMHGSDDLQQSRQQIILDLNKKISLVKLDVSLVFDAAFQEGDRTRSHFDALEILFTAEGETADEFILEEIKNSIFPQQETVVTSDKRLAWQARHRSAHTESIEEFMVWLNKSYKNKLKQLKNPRPPPKKTVASPIPATLKPLLPSPSPAQQAKAEECGDYYTRIFEERYQELLKQEKPRKLKETARPPSKKRKRAKDPFKEERPSVEGPTEMERWLKTFEERLNHPDPHAKH